jgi:tetratricopeptide (TPR) repeat protein
MNGNAHRAVTRRAGPAERKLSPAVSALFAAAVQHHQAGHLQQADALYRQVLTANPRHADSLHLLGVIALQVGRPDPAAELISRAIGIDPTVALYQINLGNAFKALGNLDQAIACYRRAIVLRPRYPEAYNNLGATLHARTHTDEALIWLRRAITLKPDFPEAHNNLGNLLADLGQLDQAAQCYRQAIALRPNYADAHNNLGTTLKDLGALDEAVRCHQTAIALRPDNPEAHHNLGTTLKRLGRLDEAAACHRKALALKPDLAEAHDALGSTLADQGKLDEAVACYQQTLALRPDDPRPHDNLGTVLKEQGALNDAIASFRTAIRLKYDFPNAHHNLGMALLARGDMEEGWPEYEWRWKTPGMAASRRDFTQPQWRGEPQPGRTLLIHAEQGLGDTLQFCRYGALAAARGLRVVMAVQPPLVRLLQNLPDVGRVVALKENPADYDLHCPMQSMPLALGTTIATIPNAPRYLHADAARVAAWGERLEPTRCPRVGLAWAGNPAMIRDRQRSLALDHLAPLLALPGLRFFSLQKDPSAAHPALTDYMQEMDDFADTAALVANLDLIISVDTAVAHLAAGMGKPVWLVDRFDPDWRWLLERRDSPWYPSLRLYRQPRPGDWTTVLAEVARDLGHLAG